MEKIGNMRARELRNFLIQRVGLNRDEILKIIDKAVLRDLAVEHVHLLDDPVFIPNSTTLSTPGLFEESVEIIQFYILSSFKILLFISIVAIICFYLSQFKYLKKYFLDIGESYAIRFRALRNARKNGRTMSAVYFSFSLAILIYISALQYKVLLGWASLVFPDLHRIDMIPSLQFLISPKALGNLGGMDQFSNHQWLNINLDVGTMLLLWLLSACQRKLDDFGALVYY